MNKSDRIYIAGHAGMVGSATLATFRRNGYSDILTRTSRELDLANQSAVDDFFARNRPKSVILCAAKVGGIQANIAAPVEFLYDNLMIQNNVIKAAFSSGVARLVFLGSSCIYPRNCPQPMKEEHMLTGELEPTNEGYALAKIAGIKLLEAYRRQHQFESVCLMPCNLYGPNDSFDLAKSHVFSALVRRFVDAQETSLSEVTLWGTGNARREFMHVDDAARAIAYFYESAAAPQLINVGWGDDITIRDLAEKIARYVGYTGKICWNSAMPDGMLRKCMDVTRMHAAGFTPTITLDQGICQMIDIYKATKNQLP